MAGCTGSRVDWMGLFCWCIYWLVW